MKVRTVIITAGAVAALAAPGLANARMLPAKHPGKHPLKPLVKPVVKPKISSSQPLYIYFPAPLVAAPDASATSDSSASSVDTSMTDDSDDC